MGVTVEQAAEIESKYRGYKLAYCSGVPLDLSGPVHILTAGEMVLIDSRILLLKQVAQAYYARGQKTDGSIITHLIGELRSRMRFNKRMLELKSAEEWDRWNNLSEGDKNYERMTTEHPEWRVAPNRLLDMTDSIVKESQSTDVQIFQAAVTSAILMRTMEVCRAPAPPAPPTPPEPIISRIAAFVGTREQFRAYVLRKLTSEPNNPLRFLLDGSGTKFKAVSSRAHSELINNPDVWEAGHIMSDKIGGNRLMIQSAWENQVQNISVEAPRVGGAVLDNPVVEVGGIPVAKSTVKLWEQARIPGFPPGTADRAPVIQ
jgi:hypothetical protein